MRAMKKSYEKPTLVLRDKLSTVTAGPISLIGPKPQ
jgi:hypothetical protein